MAAWCLLCFSEDVEERGGGRIRRCRTCGGEAERNGETWKVTKKGRESASASVERTGTMFVIPTSSPSGNEPVVASPSAAPPAAAAPRIAGPVSRGALELVDGLRFNVAGGLERLARTFREDFSFIWRCVPQSEQATLKARWQNAGGISIWVLPSPLISPGSGRRVNGCVVHDEGGLELLIAENTVQTVGHIATLAHELAHAAGELSELTAWGRAHGWLKGCGMPARHALDAFYEAGGRDVALTAAQAHRWGFGFVGAGGVQ